MLTSSHLLLIACSPPPRDSGNSEGLLWIGTRTGAILRVGGGSDGSGGDKSGGCQVRDYCAYETLPKALWLLPRV